MLTSWSRTFSTIRRSARIESLFVRTKSFSSRGFFAAGIPRRFCFCGELRGHVGRIAPQSLQPVVAPAFLGEHVNDEIAEVDQDPPAGWGPFHEQRFHTFFLLPSLQNGVRDCLRLALVVRRTKEEIVGDRSQLADCEDVQIERFLIERCRDGGANTLLDRIGHVASLYKP